MLHSVLGVQVHDAKLVALMTAEGISNFLTLNPSDYKRFTQIVTKTPKDVLLPRALSRHDRLGALHRNAEVMSITVNGEEKTEEAPRFLREDEDPSATLN